MITTERVTVTLPIDLIQGIDRLERNRSRFIAEAVQHEIALRRRQELMRSLENPHPESQEFAELGMEDWAASVAPGDEELLDPNGGIEIRWTPGEGWQERRG